MTHGEIEEIRETIPIQPKRVQRKRTAGWRMPEGVIYVGRPSKWGNPFWDFKRYGLELCLTAFDNAARGIWNPGIIPAGPHYDSWLRWLYRDFDAWRNRIGGHPIDVAQRELRGHDLACWCKTDAPCHADILLRLANA